MSAAALAEIPPQPRGAVQSQGDFGLNVSPGPDDDGWHAPPPATLADGTRLQLLKDGECLRAALDLIRSAERQVLLEMYIFDADETGRAFAALLAEKARAGVDVWVVYDGFGCLFSRKLLEGLRASGVKVSEFHPMNPVRGPIAYRPWNRDHRKLIVVDGRRAWVAGMNVGNVYGASWVAHNRTRKEQLFRDTGMTLDGPSAAPFVHAFAQTWNYLRRGGPLLTAQYAHGLTLRTKPRAPRFGKPGARPEAAVQYDVPEDAVGVLASAPTSRTPLRPLLHDALAAARTGVRLVMAYFAPDDLVVDALCACAERGCRVQLVFASRSDAPILTVAARAFYGRFLDAGAEVYERRGALLHSKTLTVDGGVSFVGSVNLDYRSALFNLELSAVVHSRAFTSGLDALIDHDVRHSARITECDWLKRGHLDRVAQWLVSRVRYVL